MEPQAEKLMMETLAKNIIDAVSPDGNAFWQWYLTIAYTLVLPF